MVQKLHHAVTDGIGGIRMSEQFIDLERDATEPIAPDRPVPLPLTGSLATTTVDTLTHNLRRGLGVARRAAEGGAALAIDPRRAASAVTEGVELGRSIVRQLVVTDHAHSPLWTSRSLRRHMEVLRAPLDDAKAAAKELGGSLNDLFVTAAAGGAGAYHRAAGVEVGDLRMAMPVNTRTDRSAGGNAFTPSRVLIPAGVEDPTERFQAVRERLTRVREERSLAAAEGLAGFANLLPTSLLTRMARQQVETVDFTTSNIRGAPFPLYIAGARIEANHPIGPLAGTAWNLTLMSYDGSLDMGLNVDAGAVTDPEGLRAAIEAEMGALVAAGQRSRRGPRRAKAPAGRGRAG
jgi:WS/DGAT/MGAT family acyltransferase